MTGETIKSQLKGDVTVRIDSPGGDVFAGFAIYNQLVQHDGKVTVYVDGAAASAASIIAMAGDEVYLPETSVMMIHDPWTMAIGDSSDMKKTAELLDTIKDAIIPAYTAKTGLETEKISDMMSEETWLTGAQAAQMGFGTLIEGGKQTASNFERPWIKNAPKPKNNNLIGDQNAVSIPPVHIGDQNAVSIPPILISENNASIGAADYVIRAPNQSQTKQPEPQKPFKTNLQKRRLKLAEL